MDLKTLQELSFPDDKLFLDVKFTGEAKVTIENKDTYIGSFVESLLHGENCEIFFKDGSKSSGKFVKGEFTTGTYQQYNVTYIGGFKKGYLYGMGKIIRENGDEYSGLYKKNRLQGRGKIIYKECSELFGESLEIIFQNNKPSGLGLMKYQNVTYFQFWKNGVLHYDQRIGNVVIN